MLRTTHTIHVLSGNVVLYFIQHLILLAFHLVNRERLKGSKQPYGTTNTNHIYISTGAVNYSEVFKNSIPKLYTESFKR